MRHIRHICGLPLPVLGLLLFCCLCWLAPWDAAHGAALGGVPQAIWQDNDRSHRRSPAQIKHQLRPPQVRAARLSLAEDAQQGRTARVRNLIAANAASLPVAPAPGEQLPLLEDGDWRLKIRQAAVVDGDMVLLGDIAAPLGEMDAVLWSDLRERQLWPAPEEEGKPLQVNRSRLSQALRQLLGREVAGRCILPTSLVIQRGGVVFGEEALRSYVVKSLTPQLAAMPGEAELGDFRLPEYIFLAHAGQRVQLEPGRLTPGRVPLRFAVQEADGTVLRRVSGTVNLTLWLTVPAAARPLAKGEALSPDSITFMRVNAGQLRDLPWDGQGGPWQTVRALSTGEAILQSDLVSQNTVRRGDVLTLDYARGNVRMTTKVEALADGGPGETIPVRNLQTKRQVYATVRDGGTVEIH
ncbi:MAG: flagellar basal body P-ring formation protein FlgA [Desulfovibrio sp.]|nr:flagellar basal body P-ring formation protein FlgA [Desulfovibrio sp.]